MITKFAKNLLNTLRLLLILFNKIYELNGFSENEADYCIDVIKTLFYERFFVMLRNNQTYINFAS
jgi:hypothetical protein